MMDKLQRIAEMERQLSELKKQVEAEQAKEWPQNGDTIYWAYSDGVVTEGEYCANTYGDNAGRDMGYIHRTPEEAEEATKKRKAEIAYKRKVKEVNGDWKPNWEDTWGVKKYLCYSYYQRSVTANSQSSSDRILDDSEYFTPYATSGQIEELKRLYAEWKGVDYELKQMEQEMTDPRKKLDEPEIELYRGWMPEERGEYFALDDWGYVRSAFSNDANITEKDRTLQLLGIFSTRDEAQASYDRHMAGEECKKIISKWIAKVEPGWKPDWEQSNTKYSLYLHHEKNISTTCDVGNHARQDEWYFPHKVAGKKDFLAEIAPHFRKWLGVE